MTNILDKNKCPPGTQKCIGPECGNFIPVLYGKICSDCGHKDPSLERKVFQEENKPLPTMGGAWEFKAWVVDQAEYEERARARGVDLMVLLRETFHPVQHPKSKGVHRRAGSESQTAWNVVAPKEKPELKDIPGHRGVPMDAMPTGDGDWNTHVLRKCKTCEETFKTTYKGENPKCYDCQGTKNNWVQPEKTKKAHEHQRPSRPRKGK